MKMALLSNYTTAILSLFLLLLSPTLLLAEPKVPCFFIFGDSMVDNGNNNNLQTYAKSNYLPYGIDFPAGPTGRFTNGRNLADFIAELLGFEKSIPALSLATNEDILKGLNYASGGAGILDETEAYFVSGVLHWAGAWCSPLIHPSMPSTMSSIPKIKEQLSNHKTTISKIVKLVGSKKAAKQHLSSCIYYMGMGNNDYLANYLPQHYASTSEYTPKQFAARLITEYTKQLKKLYCYGARKVAVFGAGKLGCTPQQVGAFGTTNGSYCYENTNDIVGIFNTNLQLLINNLNNRLPQAKFVYAKDYSDDDSIYDKFKVRNEACCATSAERYGHCVEGGATCSNRDEYYFWDAFHPTEVANAISANIAYKHMSPLFGHPSIDVW